MKHLKQALFIALILTACILSSCDSTPTAKTYCEHIPVTDPGIAPTCIENGKTEGSHCQECGIILSEQKDIPAKGHSITNKICTICGYRVPSEGLRFAIDKEENNYYVSGIGSCTDKEIVIPETYQGKPVIYIKPGAFEECTEITSVYIPKSILEIGEKAFYGCTSLETVVFEENNDPDYYGPILVTREFMENNILNKIAVENDRKRLYPQLYVLYDSLSGKHNSNFLQSLYEKYPITKEKEIYALNDLTTYSEKIRIEALLKKWCPEITKEVIDKQHAETSYTGTAHLKVLSTINNSAFENCTNLKNIKVPETVTKMGERVFAGCPNISTQTSPTGTPIAN